MAAFFWTEHLFGLCFFFQGFVNHAQLTLHIDGIRGVNAHHQCETVFKAFARALRAAIELDSRALELIPSTKGAL